MKLCVLKYFRSQHLLPGYKRFDDQAGWSIGKYNCLVSAHFLLDVSPWIAVLWHALLSVCSQQSTFHFPHASFYSQYSTAYFPLASVYSQYSTAYFPLASIYSQYSTAYFPLASVCSQQTVHLLLSAREQTDIKGEIQTCIAKYAPGKHRNIIQIRCV